MKQTPASYWIKIKYTPSHILSEPTGKDTLFCHLSSLVNTLFQNLSEIINSLASLFVEFW